MGAVRKRCGLSRLGKVTLGIVNNSGRQPQNHLEACENPAFGVPPAVSNLVDWGRGLRTGISRAFPDDADATGWGAHSERPW